MFKTFTGRALAGLCIGAGLLFCVVAPAGAAGGKRVALVIGNGAYGNIGVLRNPHNDAKAFAGVLGKVDPKFKVLTGYDVTAVEFERRIGEFEKELQGAEVGLFYFAGHSVQIGGSSGSENYLLGVDAAPGAVQDKDAAAVGEALKAARLSAVMSRMERLARTRLVFLDACRDNPLAESAVQAAAGASAGESDARQAALAQQPGGASQGTRSLGRGLTRAGLASVQGGGGAGGTYIAFATAPGEVALDGEGSNSPFTTALVRHIATRGIDIDQAMMLVRRDVKNATSRINAGRPQVPWSNTSLSDKFFFWPQIARAAPAAGAAAVPAVRRSETAPTPPPAARERQQSSDTGSPSPSLGGGVGAGGF